MKKIISLCLTMIMIGMLCSCGTKEEPKEEQIKAICELSTVEAYYNNVAKSVKEAGKGWKHFLEKDREFWIEYDGVAEIGIDMDKVDMKIKDNLITVTMPEAELLNVRIVRETFDENSYITTKDSFWDKNKITTEEQQKAINLAQDNMVKQVSEDVALFDRAERVAREMIENYVKKIGKISGVDYQVEWK